MALAIKRRPANGSVAWLDNERLKPKDLAEAVIHQALSQVPRSRRVRFAIDWTSEADQHLLVISLVVGRRALPIYWRAYRASMLI